MSAMISTIQNYLYAQDTRLRPRKNFIHENMKNLKKLQLESKEKEKIKNTKSKSNQQKKRSIKHGGGDAGEIYFKSSSQIWKSNLPPTPETEIQNLFKKNQASQTVSDAKDVYKEGLVVYSRARPPTPPPPSGMKNSSVQVDDNLKSMSDIDVLKEIPFKEDGKVDFVRLNAIIPLKKKQKAEKPDPTKIPATYQKGALPKYLLESKRSQIEEVQEKGLVEILDNEENAEQLIYLTDEEKKDHIKKLRKAYASLVVELNALPMRSDSTKVKRRRQEIEQALQSIEGGIKMFSQNKLYVKATT